MPDESSIRNEVGGLVTGAVVQAGSIQHVTLPSVVPSGYPTVVRQLPPAIRDFTGRAEQVAALDALLPMAHDDNGVAGAVVISAVNGLPGVGKTALALFWAHRVQVGFPDGTLHVNLRGYGPGEPATPGEVLDSFLRALAIPPERIPIDVEARVGLYRSSLADRRVLIVLDNANSAEQVRPLLPGSRGCLVLVTSRNNLTGLVIREGATRVSLDPFHPTEAVELIGGIVGQQRANVELDAVHELTRVCDRLPLALRIAGSRIAARPQLRIADVLAEMVDDRRRLDALSQSADEACSVRTVFGWSYHKLNAEQARLFGRLGLHFGSEISVHAAAAVAELPVAQAHRLLDDLAEVHLIEPVGPDRYRFHDLLRAYAVDRSDHNDSPGARDHAVHTLLSWYADTSAVANRVLYPAYVHLSRHGDRPPDELPAMRTRADAEIWLSSERTNLVAAVRHASECDLTYWAIQLVHTIETFLYHCAYWDELFEVCTLGIESARRIGDRASEGWFLNRTGWAQLQVSGWDNAVDTLHRALALARELRDPYLEAYARNDLGMACLRRNRYAEALDYLRPALSLSHGTDGGRREAFVQSNVSWALAGLGQYRRALAHAQRSQALRRQANDHEGEVFTLNQLAQVWQQLGDHHKAIGLCEEALRIQREYTYLPDIAAALDTLGTSLLHTGDTQQAETCWLTALDIYDKFADHRIPHLRIRLQALRTGGPSSATRVQH